MSQQPNRLAVHIHPCGSGGHIMFSLFSFEPATDHGNEEALNYEWAEFNLPTAADVAILREQNTRAEECGAPA